MLLEDLTQHAAIQQAKINQLLGVNKPAKRLCFTRVKPSVSPWAALRRSLWGKGLEFLGGQTEISNPSTAATRPILKFPRVMRNVWPSATSRILVRSEYEEAERAALSANANGMEAFLVAGHPGIGKTVFFVWLLMRRLALGLPTAIQFRDDHALLFHAKGTSRFVHLNNIALYLKLIFPHGSLGRIWVLMDAGRFLSEPAPIFTEAGPFFIVETGFPNQSSLKWDNHHIVADFFYMRTWDFSEVLQIRPYLGLSHGGPFEEHELRHLYDTYGASPRDLAKFSRKPAAYEELIMNKLWAMSIEHFCDAILSPCSSDSHFFALVEPDPENRRLAVKRIASQTMFENIWHWPLQQSGEQMRQIYRCFADNPLGAPAADWMFEFRMHGVLSRGGPIGIFPVGGHDAEDKAYLLYDDNSASQGGRDQTMIHLPTSHQILLDCRTTLDGEAILHVDEYHRFEVTEPPSINSFFLVRPPGTCFPMLLVFRMVRNETELDVDEASLRCIERLELPPGTRLSYVVVAPQGTPLRVKVPRACFLGRENKARDPDEIFPVFHYPVRLDELF